MATEVKTVTFDLYHKSKSTGNLIYVGERRVYLQGSSETVSAELDSGSSFPGGANSIGYNVASYCSVPWLGNIATNDYFLCNTTVDPFTVVGVKNAIGWDFKSYYNGGFDLVFRLKDLGDHSVREMVIETTMGHDGSQEINYGGTIKLYKDDNLLYTHYGLSALSRVGTGGGWDYPITVHRYFQGFPWYFNFNGTEVVSYASIAANYSRKNTTSAYPTGEDMGTISGQVSINSSPSSSFPGFKTWLTVDDGGGQSHVFEGDDLDEDNPFSPGGTTDPDNPNPNFIDDDDDDNIIGDTPLTDDLPDETNMGASATGFATLFSPTKTQLKNLAGLMWNATFLQAVRNLIENIKDLFVSLAMVPFNVPKGSTVTVTWFGISSGVDLTLASKQFLEFDMGTISLAGDSNQAFSFDSALDYSPFSHLGIYLPFIGYRDLDIDECRKASINLKYRIDILSGECVAIIKVGGRELYQFTGNCLSQIPISNENMQSLVADAVQVGLAVMGMQAASGVAAAEDAVAENVGGEMGELKSAHASAHLTHSRGALASATANAMLGMKPHITKTGSVSGASAMMAIRQPYLVLRTPRQAVPEHYERYCGFPSNVTGTLGSFSGYTVVEDIRLNGLVATSPEVAEIYKLLKQGVIV